MHIAQTTNNPSLDIALDTIAKKKQSLIFASSKRSAEKTAEDISKKVKGIHLHELAQSILHCLPHPTKQCKRLANCMQKGVAFHHAGLHHKQKTIIEDEFRAGTISTIACTPTLAAGIDMPAFRTVIKDVKRFSGFGSNFIPVLEYLQMAGRAGRPGKEEFGEAIVIATTDAFKEELHRRYILGTPEELYSKLAVEPVLRTYILSLIATNFVHTKQELSAFFGKTFWAHQFQDMNRLQEVIEKMLNLLKEYGFLHAEEFVTAGSSPVIKATNIGRRVSELYLDPYTANTFLQAMNNYNEHTTFSILQMLSHTLEMRPLIRMTMKEMEHINQALLQNELLLPEPSLYDPEYDEFLDSIKTTVVLSEWVNESDEDSILQKYGVRPGELNAKVDRADWLLYSCIELTRISKNPKLFKVLSRLRKRVKYGVKEELLPLLQLQQVGRIRARKLFSNNVKDISALKNVSIEILAQCVGKAVALHLKKQVGQIYNPSTIKIRKAGQLQLNKF